MTTFATSRRVPGSIFVGLMVGVLCWRAALFVAGALRAATFRYELDYGEGIVWEQLRLLLEGAGYGDIATAPYIVFHYPPLYHVVVGIVAAVGIDGLIAGRAVSLGATLAASVAVASITWTAMRGQAGYWASFAAAVAGTVPLAYQPVMHWAPLMRVDMLAVALSLWGVFCVIRAFTTERWVYLSALLFMLAVYAKQTTIVAPIASFAVLAVARPATAAKGAALCLALAGTALVALMVMTEGRFVHHIFFYNVNRFAVERLLLIPIVLLGHGLFLILVIGSYRSTWRAWRDRISGAGLMSGLGRLLQEPLPRTLAVVGAYLILSVLTLVFVGKVGSNVNYFIELMYLWAVPIGIAAVVRVDSVGQSEKTSWDVSRIAVSVIAIQMAVLPQKAHSLPHDRELAERQTIEAFARSAKKPIISDDMVMLIRAGKRVYLEPAIFSELASVGMWAEAAFVEQIESEEFEFFVTVGGPGSEMFEARYRPQVAQAILGSYPRRVVLGGYTLHLPRAIE